MEIVPPEVPRLEKKKGFFEKLFSAKKEDTNIQIEKPEIELPELPELPVMDMPNQEMQEQSLDLDIPKTLPKLKKAPKEKRKKTKIEHIDESKSFDWMQSINSQDSIIKDNNRNNQDVNTLLEASEQHVEDQKRVLSSESLSLPENLPELKFDNPIVPENNEGPVPMPVEEKKFFDKVDKSHKILRDKLKKNMVKSNKAEFMKLLKEYDLKIESVIEQRQIEFSHQRRKLSDLSKQLVQKQKGLDMLQKNLKSLQERLDKKEQTIEQTINNTVEKQLMQRSKKEKEMLRKELQKTISMNKNLKRKLDTLEKDDLLLENTKNKLIEEHKAKMVMLENNKDKLNEEHRTKMTILQNTYEKKLLELQKEKDEFDIRKKNAMELLHRADIIHKERENLEKLRDIVEKRKQAVNESLYADRELKKAIEDSEMKLSEDREKLDNTIFSKYIQWKLSEPEDSKKITELLKNPSVDEINNMIADCRGKLLSGKIIDAKKMYNLIKHKFETYDIDEYNRSELFNNIRQLYSDIQIAALKP